MYFSAVHCEMGDGKGEGVYPLKQGFWEEFARSTNNLSHWTVQNLILLQLIFEAEKWAFQQLFSHVLEWENCLENQPL